MSDCPVKEFSSFHNHSHASVMDGLSLPVEMILTAKEKGLKSIAITDHGIAHGHADFYLEGKKHGVRTVFGVEAYVIDSLKAWNDAKMAKETTDDEDATNTGAFKAAGKKGHLVLLACNREGLANLYTLIYLAHRDGFYGKPRMDKDMLRAHSKGLIASSACMGGVVSNTIWQYSRGEVSWNDVVSQATEFDRIFGRGRFYLELQLNESASQKTINKALIQIHEETGIPLSVTTDSHYIKSDDWMHQEILYMLRSKKTIATRGPDWNFEVKQLYIKSPLEMWESYEKFGRDHIPENIMRGAFDNTLLMDSLVDTFEPDTHVRLPAVKDVSDPMKELGIRCIAALKKMGKGDNDDYKRQLLHELKVIKEKGFSNYFLLVQTMINEAKKEMLVGPGRGSACGSLVCYMLGITDLDPIKHGLMFERFLDENRTELPDLDVDYQDPTRAKEMMAEIYGKDNVAALTSYGTFQIKGLMKDLSRVYDLDHTEINKINKKIEVELRALYVPDADGNVKDKNLVVINIEDVERVSKSFNEFCTKYPLPAKHFKALYGRNRHVGRHAAGIIIGDNLMAETAIFKTRDKGTGELTTQASFTEGLVNKNLGKMGFVKFDILGLATLQVIKHAEDLIAIKTNRTSAEVHESISGDNIDLDDMKVLKNVFWTGAFAGIFQFTNRGIRKVAKSIKPDSFKDVSAITALYRPGPIAAGLHKMYAGNKKKAIAGTLEFEHPILKEILQTTYNCLIYQEQLMQVGSKLGLLDGKNTQRLRKLFLKRDKSKTKESIDAEEKDIREMFLEGCKKNGYEKGQEMWEQLAAWAGYGFNKAHSDAYSKVTMQTAYLATYYPLEFYSALLTKGQSGDIQDYISDIKKTGIKVLPVDINESKLAHTVSDKSIRLSLKTTAGVGKSVIDKIIKCQPYTDFFDFLKRSKATKTAIEPLIMVGAFDCFNKNMKQVESQYQLFLTDPKNASKKWDEFVKTAKEINVEDYEMHHKVALENQLLGFSVRGSPFEILGRKKKIDAIFGDAIADYGEFIAGTDELAMLPVVVKDVKERPQRNGQMMAWVKFAAETGEEWESPAFSTTWKHIGPRTMKGSVYITTFNRKLSDPESLVIGRPGFAQSAHSCAGAMINIDELEIES